MASAFSNVNQAPVDPLFSLVAAYKEDAFDKKVDLSIGAYRDDTGKPWILPVVKKVDSLIASDPTLNHEYLPITGLKDFTSGAASIVLGKQSSRLANDQVASVQTISGTGANHLGSLFLTRFYNNKTIWMSDPTWANHKGIFSNVGLTTKSYPYWDAKTKGLNFEGMIKQLKQAEKGDIVLLHACAHNPTGVDPTQEQWKEIAKVCQERELFPFFDSAYQGFASGDLAKDAWAVQYFAELGFEMLVCQSFSKNFGLYGQRAGCLHFLVKDSETKNKVLSQLSQLQRAEISNPPAFGARIVGRTVNNPDLFEDWLRDLDTMSKRIILMRNALKDKLVELQTPGTWDHITNQIGMFSFTGLNPQQVERMINEFHIYMSKNGRISMAGLNNSNVEYVAKAIDACVRG